MSKRQWRFVEKSAASKTDGVAIAYGPRSTCPPSCAFYGRAGCYADAGAHTRLAWDRTDSGSDRNVRTWRGFLSALWMSEAKRFRFAVAGDLPGVGEKVNRRAVRALTRAATANGRGASRSAWTYTHKRSREALAAAREATADGFTVNLSANNPADADELLRHGLPVACVTARPVLQTTPAGVQIVPCPAITSEVFGSGTVTCNNCGGAKGPLCGRADRSYVIGFALHGNRAKAAAAAAGLVYLGKAVR